MNQLELPMPTSGLPMDLRGLATEIHADNIRAGWWKTDAVTGRTLNRNVGELLALVHSEISEAVHGYEHDLMDDKLPHRRMVEVELADTAIRVLDMLGFYQWDGQQYRRTLPLPENAYWPDWCRILHRKTTDALEGFRKSDEPRGIGALVDLLGFIHFAAVVFRYDLTGAIAEKRAFNATRADHKLETRAAAGGKSF